MKNTRSVFRSLPAALTLSLVLVACGGDDPVKLMQSAKDYMAKNDNAAAVIQLKNALQAKPDLAEARFLLGKAWLATGDLAGAQVELEKAKAAGYPDEQVTPLLARALLIQGQVKKVTDTYDQTRFNDASAQADLLTSLASAWLAQNKIDTAQERVATALKLQPAYEPALVTQARLTAIGKDFDGALAQLAKILKANPQSEAALKLKGDVQLFGLQQPDAALATYKEAAKAGPKGWEAQSNVVRILMGQDKLEEATTEFQALQKLAANSPTTLYLQAQLAMKKRDLKGAHEAAEKLMRASPSSPQALELAGSIELQANNLVPAESMLAKALTAAPDLKIARRALVLTYLRMGQIDKAIATLPSDQSELENDPAMLSVAGQVYMVHGDQELAQRYFGKAAALDPKNPAKRTSLALSKLTPGQSEASINELQNIAASDSGVVADMAIINVLSRQGRWDAALKAIADLEKKRPADDPVPNHLRAQVLIKKGDAAGARQALERAQQQSPDFFPAVSALAGLDVAAKQTGAAEARLQAWLKRKPDSVPGILALARVKAALRAKPDEIASLLRKAIEVAPTEIAPRQLLVAHHLQHNEPKVALTAAQNAVAALPKSPELLDTLGQAQLGAQEFNQALSTYSKLGGLLPNSTAPQMRMATVYLANKDGSGATQSLRKALSIQPNFLPAQQQLVELALRDKRAADALAVVRDVQRQRPEEAVGYALEGDVHGATQNWSAALAAFDKALKLAPDSSDLAIRLHMAHLAGQKSRDADVFAKKWLQTHPKDAQFLVHLGDRAVMGGDLKLAESQYQKALDLQPNNPLTLNNLAWVAGKNGRKDAMSLAEKAHSLAPQSPAILDTLATLQAGERRFDKAIESQKRAVALQPEDPAWKLNLAKIQLQAGEKSAAKTQLLALKQLGSGFRSHAEVVKLLEGL